MNESKTEIEARIWQAIAYCLAYELQKGKIDADELSRAAKVYERSTSPPSDPLALALYYADLATDEKLREEHKPNPKGHPLYKIGEQIGLVYGGATKIKGYVFESARLPEVRGASALLDRINRVDIRALWGETDFKDKDAVERARQVREQYLHLQSPECIIYAGGGNFLAFVPPSVARQMADHVEQIYTTQTLVANSAVVAETFSLLELLYGRRAGEYWLADWQAQWDDEELRPLLESYYENAGDEGFWDKKCFPELVTVLAGNMMRRRGEWGHQNGRQRRYIPHYELLPYAVKCHSCDVRPAVIRDEAAEKEYCEPCARKRVAGQAAKRESDEVLRWFTTDFSDWSPTGVGCWESRFKAFFDKDPKRLEDYYGEDAPAEQVLPSNDLNEIGQASSPQRYIGLIYADGNDVGAKIAGISSAAEYSQFSEELEVAAQGAVFEALAKHLSPTWIEEAVDPERPNRRQIWVHPWEIITIGGDDLIIIVPGDKALDVALSIGEKFEEVLGNQDATTSRYAYQRYQPHCAKQEGELAVQVGPVDEKLGYAPQTSLSAGVVIAHATTPIFFLWELAEQLIKSAKNWRKEMDRGRERYKGGTVDFMALKSMGMVASRLKAFRERAYARGPRQLTARPYTWVELDGLLKTARTIRDQEKSGMGRSQVYRLQEFLMEGQQSATINYLYAFARLRPDQKQALACAFNLAWHHGPDDVPPWHRRSDGTVETIWRDLVEIYDFIKQEEA